MLYCKPEKDILYQKYMYEGKTNIYIQKTVLSLKEISMCLNQLIVFFFYGYDNLNYI